MQSTSIATQPRRFPIWAAVVPLTLVAAAATALAIAFVLTRPGTAAPPSGVISYAGVDGEFAVRPDGQAAGVAPFGVLEAVPALSMTQELPGPGGAAAFLEFSTDSTWLSVRDSDGERRLGQLAGPDGPPLVAGSKGEAQSANGVPVVASWSPDGRYLAYGSVSGYPYTLHIAETASDAPAARHFEVGNEYVGEAFWSPDGKYLAVSSYTLDRANHAVFLWQPGDGKLTPLIDGCHIVWAPDSKHIVVHRDPYEQPGVSVVSVDGDVKVISDDPTAFPMGWRAQ